ncbi:ATP-dependent sacrificial sulfur transferase LarE [Thermococcus sp. LS2]|uniref:ATP-dependent sacrificial sulfur transferase LarE n=1 Tax=Thermococcus sp. LS2 TaxID=1638260 RepID=UPI00143AD513|nr:ATP-dependent sacrificial sulfur transferase LarE [Thermococcus sp. LS2]NJE13153.1 ATP-dependent sacrificial sulfur transferase LarE [Thermococcus sp. LS2]
MEKLERIKEAIKDKRKIVVMFSGGVDSTLLAKLAYDALGENSIAVTIDSPVIPRSEIKEAKRLATLIGIKHEIIKIDELKSKHLIENPPNRCYLCRKLRDAIVKNWAEKKGFEIIADGLNYSDLRDYRPGVKASTEDGIWHPFIEFQVTKEEIRKYSKLLGLPTWNKPSMACLCSRFPYGFGLTKERVETVEKAEEFLKGLGFRDVRVRYFPYNAALIEVDDLEKALRERDEIVAQLKTLGFSFVSIDLEGFKSGKLNRILLR